MYTYIIMRVNIYIRKENEAAWEESGKSDWINSLLRPQFKGTDKGVLLKAAKQASKSQEETIQKANDKIAFDAFNGANTKDFTGTLTCKDGHPSKDGKYCSNIKCSYFN